MRWTCDVTIEVRTIAFRCFPLLSEFDASAGINQRMRSGDGQSAIARAPRREFHFRQRCSTDE
jgi:hypothetical protein